jgi:hypothetical protein
MSVLLPLILASSILATPLARQNTRQYTVYNKCPIAIDLYIGGTKHDVIPINGNVTKSLGPGAGYFYTDANDGNQNTQGTIRAGFYNVSWNSLFDTYRGNEMDNFVAFVRTIITWFRTPIMSIRVCK